MRENVSYCGSRPADRGGHAYVLRVEPGNKSIAIGWRLDLRSHSPDGPNWGYGGSGPAQCALAILADYLEDNDELALALHQDFKFRFVAGFGDTWSLDGREIHDWITGSGRYQYEDNLRMRKVERSEFVDGGYKVTLSCGHTIWSALELNQDQSYCGQCLDTVIKAIRAKRAAL